MVRFQHQSTEVQIADILTKDLGKNLHRKHRKVIFGDAPIVINSVPLPDSHKVYVRRHNDELAQRTKTTALFSGICAMCTNAPENKVIEVNVTAAPTC